MTRIQPGSVGEMSKHNANKSERGFSLIELAVSMVVSVVLLLSLYATVRLSFESRKTAERKYESSRQAADYYERFRQLPFGSAGQSAASGGQLTELFDADEDLGSVTLTQLKVAPSSNGHTFQLQNGGKSVNWRVKVTSDLDGDGKISGGREGRDDILRVEIWANERLQLQTLRSSEPAAASKPAPSGVTPPPAPPPPPPPAAPTNPTTNPTKPPNSTGQPGGQKPPKKAAPTSPRLRGYQKVYDRLKSLKKKYRKNKAVRRAIDRLLRRYKSLIRKEQRKLKRKRR